jgi:hypothetical protein
MKTFLKILAICWLILWVFFGVVIFLETPGQIKRDTNFIDSQLKPSVNFVSKFMAGNNRLPLKREFYTWARVYYKDYSSDHKLIDDSLINGESLRYIRYFSDLHEDELENRRLQKAISENSYAIAVWRGEWMEYYFGNDSSYDTNNYNWKSSSIMLLEYLAIGLIPIIVWLVGRQLRK